MSLSGHCPSAPLAAGLTQQDVGSEQESRRGRQVTSSLITANAAAGDGRAAGGRFGLSADQRASLLAAARPSPVGAASAPSSPLPDLPMPPTPLIGRDGLVVEVAALFR